MTESPVSGDDDFNDENNLDVGASRNSLFRTRIILRCFGQPNLHFLQYSFMFPASNSSFRARCALRFQGAVLAFRTPVRCNFRPFPTMEKRQISASPAGQMRLASYFWHDADLHFPCDSPFPFILGAEKPKSAGNPTIVSGFIARGSATHLTSYVLRQLVSCNNCPR